MACSRRACPLQLIDRMNALHSSTDPAATGDDATLVPARLAGVPMTEPADEAQGVVAAANTVLATLTNWLRVVTRYGSLIILLAFMTAVPGLQILTFGYLLEVSGRLARGEKLAASLPWLAYANRLTLAFIAGVLVTLPVHLLYHWSSVADLVDPGSDKAASLRFGGDLAAVTAFIYLTWAWLRGGRLTAYLWPAPGRFFQQIWRPQTWLTARDQAWELTLRLHVPQLFWLGLLGLLGTFLWIVVPAVLIITAIRQGEGGGAGVLGIVAFLLMGVGLTYLPVLQTRLAKSGRLRSMFQIRSARNDFRQAPWAITIAMLALYLLAVPLYLLKIETLPPEVQWLPCLLFIALALPSRIGLGFALRRSGRLPIKPGLTGVFQRATARLAQPVIVGTYLLAIFVSQFFDASGLDTWLHQHAILIPAPLIGR